MDAITYDLTSAGTIVTGESDVALYPRFLDAETASGLAATLSGRLDWRRLTGAMFGRTYDVPRDTCWVGPLPYAYSGLHHDACEWPEVLLPLRHGLEDALGVQFETVLANRYCDGRDKVGWHADDEPIFGTDPVIASVSLGATRAFRLRHSATKEVTTVDLTSVSLLVMRGATQRQYRHCVPEHRGTCGERINLTFRTLGPGM